jgi:hypothetical protein
MSEKSTTVIGGATHIGKRKTSSSKFNWLAIKREYITDPTASYPVLAKKYGVSIGSITAKGATEKWGLLREEIQRKAELALTDDAENEILEVKKRHVRIARLMQKVGLEALEKSKYVPRSSKEAREFIIEGVKMEKESMGLDKQQKVPAIVNIVNQEKAIVDKYANIQEAEIIS